PPKLTTASLDALLGLACAAEEAGLEFARSHSCAVIDNSDHTAIRLAKAVREDCHCTGVSVVAVLNKLNQCGRVPSDQEISQLRKEMRVYGEGWRVNFSLRSRCHW